MRRLTFLLILTLLVALIDLVPAAAQGTPLVPGLAYPGAETPAMTYHGTWQQALANLILFENAFGESGVLYNYTTDPTAWVEFDIGRGAHQDIRSIILYSHNGPNQSRFEVCINSTCVHSNLTGSVYTHEFSLSFADGLDRNLLTQHVIIRNAPVGPPALELAIIGIEVVADATLGWPTPIPWPTIEATPFIDQGVQATNALLLAHHAINAWDYLNHSDVLDGIATILIIIITVGLVLDSLRKFTRNR